MSLAIHTDRTARAMLDAGEYEVASNGHDGARLCWAVRDLMIYAAGIGYDPRYLAEQASDAALEQIRGAADGGELPRVPASLRRLLGNPSDASEDFSALYGAFQDAHVQEWQPDERLAAYVWLAPEDAE